MCSFKKITPYNGFYENPALGQQNNYAWSMTEMDQYIYVGTGRNIVYSVLRFVFNVPEEDIPEPLQLQAPNDPFAEIWRYNRKHPAGGWQRVYKAAPPNVVLGFRFMITYKGALYAGGNSQNTATILKSTDGLNWVPVNTGITDGDTTRAMLEYNGTLYLALMQGLGKGESVPLLYKSNDPENQGWTKIDTTGILGKNPRGSLSALASYNGHLYVGTTGYHPDLPNRGFEVWRTNGTEPVKNEWTLVVDQGAGEALNQFPLTMTVFKKHLYVGTGNWFGIYSIYPESDFVPPKGFDLIRINCNDRWEVIVGNAPIAPTQPTTNGIRCPKLLAGLGDISNAYCWQLEVYNNKLYLGSWDWSILLSTFLLSLFKNHKEVFKKLSTEQEITTEEFTANNQEYNYLPLIKSILTSLPTLTDTMGGDLWVSNTGCDWESINLTGLNNPRNYGLRTLMSSYDGNMYIGTANPYEGCEVWKFNIKRCTDYHFCNSCR